MLNELDRELGDRGHQFVRYAGGMVILCRSKRSARRILGSIAHFIESRLFLGVNREKSKVCHIRR